MGIGKRIKQAREELKLTQKELGDILGVTGSSVTNYENETSHPKEPIMYRLIEALKVDANFLFQDCVNVQSPAVPINVNLTVESIQIARAYECTDSGTQASVRKLLDIETQNKQVEKSHYKKSFKSMTKKEKHAVFDLELEEEEKGQISSGYMLEVSRLKTKMA